MAISNEERIARLEGGYEHLATKADIADVRAEFKSDISAAQVDINRRIDRLFWAVIRDRWRATGRRGGRPGSGCLGLTIVGVPVP